MQSVTQLAFRPQMSCERNISFPTSAISPASRRPGRTTTGGSHIRSPACRFRARCPRLERRRSAISGSTRVEEVSPGSLSPNGARNVLAHPIRVRSRLTGLRGVDRGVCPSVGVVIEDDYHLTYPPPWIRRGVGLPLAGLEAEMLTAQYLSRFELVARLQPLADLPLPHREATIVQGAELLKLRLQPLHLKHKRGLIPLLWGRRGAAPAGVTIKPKPGCRTSQ